jgi:hypothetical protein
MPRCANKTIPAIENDAGEPPWSVALRVGGRLTQAGAQQIKLQRDTSQAATQPAAMSAGMPLLDDGECRGQKAEGITIVGGVHQRRRIGLSEIMP